MSDMNLGIYRMGDAEIGKASLQSLPIELVESVLFFLDLTPPSSVNLALSMNITSEPVGDITCSSNISLKSLSLVSRVWRNLTLHRLFKHIRLRFASVRFFLGLADFQAFLRFVTAQSLGNHIESVVVLGSGGQDSCVDRVPEPGRSFWPLLFAHVDPKDVIVYSTPELFGFLTAVDTFLGDVWAYEIPFQLLHLQQPRKRWCRDIHHSSGSLKSLQETLFDPHCLFAARPWAHLSINDGSSIKCYRTYEYWNKRLPSILQDSRLSGCGFKYLTSLNFAATFPQSSQIRLLLQFVCLLTQLKTLRVQLLPGNVSDSAVASVLEMMVTTGGIDPSDLWSEVTECYVLILRTVIGQSREAQLTRFESGDWVKVCGERQESGRMATTKLITEVLEGWEVLGNGCWEAPRGNSEGDPITT